MTEAVLAAGAVGRVQELPAEGIAAAEHMPAEPE